ncbi:MAG: hypothetical protein IPJ81_18425 [Chitinophagaceae bacterium]|nr:hypothetical protein [Chitinophagaceae bacterium]
MKYFLPRILELVADNDFPCHSPEATFTRLDLDILERWHKEEIEILANFSTVYFEKCLNIYPLPNERIDTIILMFGIAHFDLNTILNSWLQNSSTNCILHVTDLIINSLSYKNTEPYKLVNSFSTDETDKIVLNWINEKIVKNIFSESIEKIMNQDNQVSEKSKNELSWTYEFMKK